MKSVNIFIFIWYILITCSYVRAIERLEQRYRCKDLKINCLCFNIWILQTQDRVQKALSLRSQPKKSFMVDNFCSSHYHRYGIGDLELGDEYWKVVHSSLSKSLNSILKKGILNRLMRKHMHLLLVDGDVKDGLKDFVSAFWSEFCFGSQYRLHEKYLKMREHYTKALESSFYHNRLRSLPIIGKISCMFWRYINRNSYSKGDTILHHLLDDMKSSFMKNFMNDIDTKDYDDDISNRLVTDNAFLACLVEDFIYMVCLEAILSRADSDSTVRRDSDPDLNVYKSRSLKKGFLFKWRLKRIGNHNGEFNRGDYVLVNLVESERFFSWGPRSCIGPKFFEEFYGGLNDILEPYIINTDMNKSEVVVGPDPNVPIVTSIHNVEYVLRRDYLKDHLPYSKHKGVERFYHVHKMTTGTIFNHTVREMAKVIDRYELDMIVAPEARGWLFSSAVAEMTNLPLGVVRKAGKLPGELYGVSYAKSGYDGEDRLEIPLTINSLNVAIIDDGIASGKTIDALYGALTKYGNVVKVVCCAIDHTYVENKFKKRIENTDCDLVTIFDL